MAGLERFDAEKAIARTAHLPGQADGPVSLSRSHLFAILVCSVGFIFDLSEIAFGSALSGIFSAPPYALPPNRLAWLLASNYVGAIVGPPLIGTFADRRGRRLAMIMTCLCLSLSTFLAACSPNLVLLGVFRALAGILLGAFPPLMITYLTELLPPALVGRLIMITVALGYLGPPATIFLMRWLTSSAPFGFEGWRWVLMIDGVGAGTAGLLALGLAEPARWLKTEAIRDRTVSDPALSVTDGRLIYAAALSFLTPWATVAFPLLTGAILVAKGFDLSSTLLYVGLSMFGPFIASVAAVPVVDSVRRRTALLACAYGMSLSAVAFYVTDQPAWLISGSVAFNIAASIYLSAINVYIAEAFPPPTRARATAWAWSSNRVAAALAPLVLLPTLHRLGVGAVFTVILAALTITVLLLLLIKVRGYEPGQQA